MFRTNSKQRDFSSDNIYSALDGGDYRLGFVGIILSIDCWGDMGDSELLAEMNVAEYADSYISFRII
jgi:hypothetical protein